MAYLASTFADERLVHFPLRAWIEECKFVAYGDVGQCFEMPALLVVWANDKCNIGRARVVY